ncbi:MAG: hypothetical protein WB579_11020 [Bryobacteraceae bacterium]
MESVENSKSQSEFSTLSTGLGKSGQKQERRIFHISTAPAAAAVDHSERTKNEPESKFQLTDRGQFRHHRKASVASLRS